MSSVDFEGRVTSINYNNATRDSVLDLPLHQVQPFYSALRRYVDIMTRPENVVTYRLEPGELATHASRLRRWRPPKSHDPLFVSTPSDDSDL